MSTDDGSQFKNERRKSDTKNIDSELIGIVYEVAFDPHFWPDLLESVGNLFEDRRSNGLHPRAPLDNDFEQVRFFSNQIEKGEARRFATLLPHLYRALKLKRKYTDVDHLRGQAQAIIEQFPVGVLLVNAEGKLISSNKHALDAIAGSNAVFLKNNVLCTAKTKQNQRLKHLIFDAANTTLDDANEHISSINIKDKEEKSAISLLITPDPYANTYYDQRAENYAAIFITSISVTQKIAAPMLQSLFNISPAEARLAALLASGADLSQAAKQAHISKNTAKVQLKSIFSKTGINRQAELIKLILTSPAVFSSKDTAPKKADNPPSIKYGSRIYEENHLILRDGRNLQYAEFGDPQGKPVIHIHGALGCRYERYPDDILTKKLGVRLIVPDRPGYGLSGHTPGHGYLDFADDLLELIDHLDIQRCSIMGLSVGAIYGSAFAYKTPDRLRSIAMISSTPPFRSFADFEGVPASLKLLMAFSKYLPTAANMVAEIAIINACKNPKKFLDNIPVCTSDRAIFSRPSLKKHFEECLLAGSRDCHTGFVQDILLSAESWPFPVENILKKIDFWHGSEDTHSPIGRIMPVIDAVPNKRFHKIQGGGHFLIYDHWQEILESLVH